MAKNITVKVGLLSEDVQVFKNVKAGTKIGDLLEKHNIVPDGDIIVNNKTAKPGTVLKVNSVVLVVPKVEGA